jgi:hypothetical protein
MYWHFEVQSIQSLSQTSRRCPLSQRPFLPDFRRIIELRPSITSGLQVGGEKWNALVHLGKFLVLEGPSQLYLVSVKTEQCPHRRARFALK